MGSDKDIAKSIRRAAMNMLARREHTQKELLQKLSMKFPLNKNLILPVISQLEEHDLQSDQRFAENYLRWRADRGYGLNRISMELSQKGVEDEVLESALQKLDLDWEALLRDLYQRKFGDVGPLTFEEKGKIQKFLMYRGFSNDLIKSFWRGFSITL